MYVSGSTDTGNKGRLASRFGAADGRPKPFDIKHPSKEGYRLRYACIEQRLVYIVEVELEGEKIIKLPDYWKDLVDVERSQFTRCNRIGIIKINNVKRWDSEFVYLQAQGGLPINCFYHVYAARKDVNPLMLNIKVIVKITLIQTLILDAPG